MPNKPCLDQENSYYHVYNRGVNKQDIFLEAFDNYFFLKLLKQAKAKFDIQIKAFCLMKNHYHLLLYTKNANLSAAMKFIGESYAKYFLKKYKAINKVGHTFGGCYGRKLVTDDKYAKILLNYIHLNPVKDQFTDHPQKYQWSSYESYLYNQDQFEFLDIDDYKQHFTSFNNQDFEFILRHMKSFKDIKKNITKRVCPNKLHDYIENQNFPLNIYNKIYAYSMLEWTSLKSDDLEPRLLKKASTIRKIRSRVLMEIDNGEEPLDSIVLTLKKEMGLF